MGVSLEKYCGPVPETAKSKWKFCRLYNPLYMRTYKTAAPERTGSTKKLKISEKKKNFIYLNFLWKSCTEHKSLAFSNSWHGVFLNNTTDLRFKPHVQHSICFIQNEESVVIKIPLSPGCEPILAANYNI